MSNNVVEDEDVTGRLPVEVQLTNKLGRLTAEDPKAAVKLAKYLLEMGVDAEDHLAAHIYYCKAHAETALGRGEGARKSLEEADRAIDTVRRTGSDFENTVVDVLVKTMRGLREQLSPASQPTYNPGTAVFRAGHPPTPMASLTGAEMEARLSATLPEPAPSTGHSAIPNLLGSAPSASDSVDAGTGTVDKLAGAKSVTLPSPPATPRKFRKDELGGRQPSPEAALTDNRPKAGERTRKHRSASTAVTASLEDMQLDEPDRDL